MKLKIGLVGATGLVGETFLKLIEERNFPVNELRPFASEKSKGQKITLYDQEWEIQTLHENCFKGLDLVFFSSGDDISLEWAPKAVEDGAFAIDNSAAFRMNPDYPLVVPEINSHELPKKDSPDIIANPNCSTIQLVLPLEALKKQFGINRVNVATYQSVSGAGKLAQQELIDQQKAFDNETETPKPTQFSHQILHNCLPEIGSFSEDGFCSEELKIINESKKILDHPNLNISAFTVRVPTLNGHSEAVWVTLDKEVTREEVVQCFKDFEGLEVIDDLSQKSYPTVQELAHTNPVYVGRIHQDISDKKTWLFWVVADNIRKGAALNGIQIAEKLAL